MKPTTEQVYIALAKMMQEAAEIGASKLLMLGDPSRPEQSFAPARHFFILQDRVRNVEEMHMALWRLDGATWDQIGGQFGVTRQGAHFRFHKPIQMWIAQATNKARKDQAKAQAKSQLVGAAEPELFSDED